MAVRVRIAGSGTLVAWKVPWPDVFLTEERLLSAVSPLGDMVGHARSYHTCQSSHGGNEPGHNPASRVRYGVPGIQWPPPMRAAARFSSSWRMILYMRHLGDSGVLLILGHGGVPTGTISYQRRDCVPQFNLPSWCRPGIPEAGERRRPGSGLLRPRHG